MLKLAAAFLIFAVQQPDSTRTAPDTMSLPPTAAQLADAYEDDVARELVHRARERRRTVDHSIEAYRALARERISAALRLPGRDRTLYGRETATRIDWKRHGPIRLDVLGAREVVPPLMSGQQVPAGLRNFVPRLAFDPGNSEVLLRLNDDFLRNPLAPNGERHYRYRSGDTTEIRLPDGRAVRLVELRILPRRADFHLLRGSFWIERETNAVVQAVFRPARALDPTEDEGDVPGLLKPIRLEIDYITLEYAFWDFRWWLPRTLAAEGVLQVTRLLKMPFGYTLSYSDYAVEGDSMGPVQVAAPDSAVRQPCTAGWRMAIHVRPGDSGGPVTMNGTILDSSPPHTGGRTVAAPTDSAAARSSVRPDTVARGMAVRTDSATAAAAAADSAGVERRTAHMDEATGRGTDRCGRVLQIDLPADSAILLASEYLPATIYETGAGWDSDMRRVRELAEWLGRIEEAPWRRPDPSFAWGLGAPGLVRYNRVEGLSIGARTELDLGRLRLDATGRLALAEPRPDLELAVTRPTLTREYRLSAYNGVREVDPATRAFGIGNSFNALLFGRDDGEYYRALGASLEVRPALTRPQWYALRLFAERQDAVDTEADFSIPTLWDGDRAFHPNIAADQADLFGGGIQLSGGLGRDPTGWRARATFALDGAGGDFEFGRAALTLRAGPPPVGPLAAAFEAAAGSSIGDVPVQRLFYLGGPSTLRGYDGNAARGEAYWRARAELAYGGAFSRLALFGDAARAGDRDAFTFDGPLRSVGLAATFLNGLVRADLARALDGRKTWRLDLWVNVDGF